jgi:hypothetical protein
VNKISPTIQAALVRLTSVHIYTQKQTNRQTYMYMQTTFFSDSVGSKCVNLSNSQDRVFHNRNTLLYILCIWESKKQTNNNVLYFICYGNSGVSWVSDVDCYMIIRISVDPIVSILLIFLCWWEIPRLLWQQLCKGELHNLSSHLYIIMAIKSRSMRLVGQEMHIEFLWEEGREITWDN